MDMDGDIPILGFRQDRVGARLVGILSVLRLGETFGVPARFAWLSQPDGPYPDLADPAEILDAGFVRDRLVVVDEAPDLTGRTAVTARAVTATRAQFAAELARGARWSCDAAFDMVAFRDEPPAEVAADTVRLAAALPLSADLARARDRALRRLDRLGADPVAIHLRRGDILDGDPWSYRAWPAKYVPDEFFRAFVAGTPGPVLAFSDTPAAIAHMARGEPRVVAVGDLIDGLSLTTVQRDVLELLLMARCRRIGAPSHSAFSRAAHLLGGAQVASLPAALARPDRLAACDALLERVLTAPESFLAPGDLAQSLHHAAGHAGTVGRGADLVAVFRDRHAFLDRFPFVMGDLAALALKSGLPQDAARLAGMMRDNPRLRERDRSIAAQIDVLGAAMTPGGTGGATGAARRAGDYVTDLFTGNRAEGPVMPRLGWSLLTCPGPAAGALMMPPALARRLAAPDDPEIPGMPVQEMPPWVVQIGWPELIGRDEVRRRLHQWPVLSAKLAPVAPALAAAEAALAASRPLSVAEEEAQMLAHAGSALTLHMRLMRAVRLFEALAAVRPDDAMVRKRMADACFAAGNARAGWRWLDAALERAPDAALIHLSAAARAGADAPARALRHLTRARALWPDLDLTRRMEQRLKKAARRG